MEGLELFVELMQSVNTLSMWFVFGFGAFFGSFLNVCIGRMPVGKSIVWPGSACTACGVPLAWWQNLPLVSYVCLGGRCHECHTPFSVRYLLLEVVTGLVAALVFHRTGGLCYEFWYYFCFSCLLIVVFFVDLDAWIILDEVNYFGIAVGVLGAWWIPLSPQAPGFLVLGEYGWDVSGVGTGVGNVGWALCGAASGFVLFRGIAVLGSLLARQEAMGWGDVKLAAMIGAFLGPQLGAVALFLAFPLGAVVAGPVMLLRRTSGKTPVPFGTFMAVGALMAIVAGDRMLLALASDWMLGGL